MNIIKSHMKKRIEKICGESENVPNFQEIENSQISLLPQTKVLKQLLCLIKKVML